MCRRQSPTTHWRTEFEHQSTRVSLAKVHAFATTRARLLASDIESAAATFVTDALADTFAGVVPWNPEEEALEAHLCRSIDIRIERLLGVSDADESSVLVERLEQAVSCAFSRSTCETRDFVVAANTRLALASLRELATGDERVLQLLEGLEDRVDLETVQRRSGMTGVDRDHARRRLGRLVGRLPSYVRWVLLHSHEH